MKLQIAACFALVAFLLVSMLPLSTLCGATQTISAASPITLDFWTPFAGVSGEEGFWNNVTSAYYNQTGNVVRVSFYWGDELSANMATAFENGSPPDLFITYGGTELDTYVNEGVVTDISTIFDENWAQAQIGSNVKTMVTINGGQYALPFELDSDWLFINIALFNKYNVTVPSMDTGWTWDQFIAACNTLKAAGVTPVAMSGADPWAMTFPECYMFERINGINAFKDALARKTNFTTPYTSTFDVIKQWVDGNYFETGWETLHYTDAAQLFQSGSAAMWIQGTWGVEMISDDASIPMQLGVAQWPYFPDHPEANRVIFGQTTSVAIAAASQHKLQAEDFLRFISQPQWIVEYAQQTHSLVAQTVTMPNGTYPPVMTDIQAAIAEAPMLHMRFGSMAPLDLAATLDEQNLLVWTEQKSPADAAAAIEAKAVQVIGPVGAPNTSFVHDVSVMNVTIPLDRAYQGWIVKITAMVANLGNATENFTVTLDYDSNVIGTEPVADLMPNATQTLLFTWNTTNVPYSYVHNYTITAIASTVLGETNVTYNELTGGQIQIRIVGDVNGDAVVNMKDVQATVTAFNSFPGSTRWNPDCDLSQDGRVDMRDINIVIIYYNRHS